MSQIEKTKSDISLRMRKNKVYDRSQSKGNNFNLSIYEKKRTQSKNEQLFIVPWQMLQEDD